jgi:transcriptional regulator with XRE-family HTH domain
MAFSERIKELRLSKNLTQEQLAAELKITKRSIIKYEMGHSVPGMNVINRARDFFKVSTDYLMDSGDEFIAEAQERGGYRGKRGAERLIKDVSAVFAGGELSEADKDAVMRALQEAYWDAKQENKKYTPKKYRK